MANDPRAGLWMHVKRGGVYEFVGEAKVQTDMIGEGDTVVVYRDIKTGELHARLTQDFLDGRFLPVVRNDDKTQ